MKSGKVEYPYFLHKIWWVMHFMIIFAGIDEKTRNLKIYLDVCKSTIYPPPPLQHAFG